MNNSKSRAMTLATAALALCMAGSAFAQDRRGDDHDQRGPGQRQEQQHNDRSDFRDGRQADRRGTPQPHAQWRRGGRVPAEYRGRNHVVDDWRGHRLQQPPRGYPWVGVGGGFVLAAIATGVIAQIIAAQ